MEKSEFELMRDKALSQLRNGQSLTGKDGAFAPLIQQFLEQALEAEMNAHLSDNERLFGNKRNGKGSKTIKTSSGEVTIRTPQDRLSNFEPQIIRKRETILADNLAPQIIALYKRGMSFRDISKHIEELYDMEISHSTLSEITERVVPLVKEWQSRPLEKLYTIVWMDAMYYKVREGGQVTTRSVYNVLAVTKDGYKDLIGMYVSESEGAKFWLSVLTDLKNRGVKDILIACTDNLKGFAEAINAVFPGSEIQTCIIHQIRNSLKYVASKDRKEFMREIKLVYQAATRTQAELELDKLDDKWMKTYPLVIKSWRSNWDRLSTYFDYDEHIRKLIYTTNPVEAFHRQIRKTTKTKGAFPNDMALMKLIYLAVEGISEKWISPLTNWGITSQQLHIRFGERMQLDI